MSTTETDTGTGPVTMMENRVALTYHDVLAPNVRRFAEQLVEGRITGHRCPVCGLVYIPPKGYCPIDVVPTTDADEVVAPDRGVVTAYTIVTPVQYFGQKETEDFVRASVLLDDVHAVLGLQDILDIPHDQVHLGLRVEAVWAPKEERNFEGMTNRDGVGGTNCITGWRPTGEPDMDPGEYERFVF